ncbi:MAG: MBOAT family O-acyltransferase [Flavobacteriales bacterium]|jgi:alginate O-acetyltransferase complex protein AlgI|tara:strand:- start:4062 stop:5723 length:1662 start_codon:yes stop_codon:yes gene_type:complete
MDWSIIEQWFTYQENSPLLFTQRYFWVFFAFVMGGFSLVYKHTARRNVFLFAVSLFFYYKTSGFYFIILLFSTVVDFVIGWAIYTNKVKWQRQFLVALSVLVNLMVLGYFKYAYFVVDFLHDLTGIELTVINSFALWTNQAVGTNFVFEKILLPVGISFFTFQTISYSVDIYRGHVKPVRNILDFGFYVSFFPQLVAGPIVRASEFIPQIHQPYQLSKQRAGLAVFWILNGLLKKLFLADYLAVQFIDRVFDNPQLYSGFETMSALFGYSLQVYADFSGYTDVAIGIAMLLGFTLPKNFNSPYKASSVADFWRRWHLSLSTWLRDYLYIPLGGNRKGSIASYVIVFIFFVMIALIAGNSSLTLILSGIFALGSFAMRYSPVVAKWVNTNINLMLTMILGGLWHGASWNFVTWGTLNGIGLVVYKNWKKVSPWADKKKWYNRAIGLILTLTFITFTRAWFRSPTWNGAIELLTKITNDFGMDTVAGVVTGNWKFFSVMLLGYIIHWIPGRYKSQLQHKVAHAPVWILYVLVLLSTLVIYQILSAEVQPFIYFAF